MQQSTMSNSSGAVDERLTSSLNNPSELISSSSVAASTNFQKPIPEASSDGAVNGGNSNYNHDLDRTNAVVIKSSLTCPSPTKSDGRFRLMLRSVTVEPAIFVHMMVTTIESTVLANLVLHKICLHDMGLPDSECLYNMSNSTVEKAVQVDAANIQMYVTLTDTFPGIMMAMLMGAYSDRWGRKLPIILPIVGYILSSIMFGIFAFYEQLPVIFLCLAVLPRGFGGGLIAFNSSCLSYVSDASTPERRTERVAMVESALFLGTPIGIIFGGYLSVPSYIVYAYVLGCGLDILVVVYLIVIIRNPPTSVGSCCDHLKDFFNFRNMKLTFATIFKRRVGNGRMHVLLLFAALFPHLFAFFGSSSVMYLYVRLQYSWDILTFSYFSAMSIVAVAIGLLLTIFVFVRRLHMSDIVLAMSGTVFAIVYNLSITFNGDSSTIYFVCIPAALSSTGMLAIRSMISKLVPSNEQGKVFSVSASLDAVVPIMTTIIYTKLYTSTLTFFPAACFVLSAVVLVIPLILLAIIYVDLKVSSDHEVIGYITIDP